MHAFGDATRNCQCSISTFNLILSGGDLFGIKATLTANASATLFTAPSAQLQLAPVRDYRISGELDLPIPPIAGSKKSTISVSGLFQDLIQEGCHRERGLGIDTRQYMARAGQMEHPYRNDRRDYSVLCDRK